MQGYMAIFLQGIFSIIGEGPARLLPSRALFEPLYKEIAEVLADQDVDKLDPHFFGYGDEGDFDEDQLWVMVIW